MVDMRGIVRAIPLALLLVAGGAAATPARAAEFPAGDSGYHTYAEMSAEVAAAAADHPAIMRRFSIGESHHGRTLWAAKISDDVATDEDEPEVLFDGLHHGNEHMSLEMTLRILRWLTDGYGQDPRITQLVDTREIWIVFAVNPDGAAFDIAGSGRYKNWRKNRQPTPGSSSTGTDLNRNYPYRWGCCGGSSAAPSSSMFRGRDPLSAPETEAFADFVRSRVVGGRQQIRASISFHTTGRLVMWPYGYTHTDVPGDMTSDDHDVFRRLGRQMADQNGYRPIQASQLYISSGTSRDWLYGTYRIFAYTFELSRNSTPFPPDEKIPHETNRNRGAVLTLVERAGCPYDLIGKGDLRCGAFDDDFEVTRGWTVDPSGTDTANDGTWQRADPDATGSNGPKQLANMPSGRRGLVTGAAAGSTARSNDLDGGITTIRSPLIDLAPQAGQDLRFRYTFAHGADSSAADRLRVSIVAGGQTTTVFEVSGGPSDRDGDWSSASASLDAWAGQSVRILISATDGAGGSLVEAAVDNVRVTRP
jgi:hypothetical protein